MDINRILQDPLYLKNKINTEISQNDQMYTGKKPRYFSVGADAIVKICYLLKLTNQGNPDSILDFACGYGRVARFLSAVFPDSLLITSDVMQNAIDFCAQHFHSVPYLSDHDFNKIHFEQPFSLIWSGSLLTHLNEDKAVDLLNFFDRSLKETGLVVFTIHGRSVARKWATQPDIVKLKDSDTQELARQFSQGNYVYSDYSHMDGYGLSLTPFHWIVNKLNDFPQFRIASFIERGWDNHQDIVALLKRPIDEKWEDTNPQIW